MRLIDLRFWFAAIGHLSTSQTIWNSFLWACCISHYAVYSLLLSHLDWIEHGGPQHCICILCSLCFLDHEFDYEQVMSPILTEAFQGGAPLHQISTHSRDQSRKAEAILEATRRLLSHLVNEGPCTAMIELDTSTYVNWLCFSPPDYIQKVGCLARWRPKT